MNVLEITHDYYGSKVYQRLFEKLQNYVNLTIVVPLNPKKKDDDELRNDVYNIFTMKQARFSALKTAKETASEIERKIDLSKIDIIHAHYARDGLVAFLLKKKYGIPYTVSVRISCCANLSSKLLYKRWIIKLVLRNATNIVFISNATRSRVLELTSGKLKKHIIDNSVVIPNGIDDFWLNNLYNLSRMKSSVTKVLTVGGLCKRKNQTLVAKAIEELISEGFSLQYLVVGPVWEQDVADTLKRYPFVKFLGTKTKEELVSIYREADIFACPSLLETFGLVYAEALSQGLPVIYSKGEGFDGWFTDESIGIPVDSENISQIKNAIKKLSVTPRPEWITKRNNMAKQFDWSISSRKYADLYKNACSLNKSTV